MPIPVMKQRRPAPSAHAAGCPYGAGGQNCVCIAGERVDRAYAHDQIRSLEREMNHWRRRLAVS